MGVGEYEYKGYAVVYGEDFAAVYDVHGFKWTFRNEEDAVGFIDRKEKGC